MRLGSPGHKLLLAGLLVVGSPRLAKGATARVRVISFVELSARACESDPDRPYAGHECGTAIEDPPPGCKCTPYLPTYLELRTTVAGATIPTAQYQSPTEYQSVTLDPDKNASCTVFASTWKGEDDANAPKVIETSLVLQPNQDYSLLLVGYLDRASYRPDSGEILPGKFGELYAVLLEDAAPPPRGHMGIIRLINVSPATSVLLGRISDNGRKLADFVPDGTAYVCNRPDQCEHTLSRSCRPVAFERAFPPGPPPPPATCNPNHKDEKTGNYEGCPAFNHQANRAYSCRDPEVTRPCERNPPCSSPTGFEGCEPDWDLGNTMIPPVTNATVCQRCKCKYRRIINQMAKTREAALSKNDSYCMMWQSDCPGKPILHHGSLLDPCPGPTGTLSSTTCWRAVDPDYPDDLDVDTLPCDNCITDRTRSWSEKCYACPCPAGAPAPPPAPCGPWANPTKSSKQPRQDKAYLISQKNYDGIKQSPTFAIGVEEVPFVDVPAGVHTIELLDGKLPYPIHQPLRADVNVPVGKAITVFIHGLPPSKPYPNGHPASPLGLGFTTGDLVSTFAQVKIASTVDATVTISANQTVGSATSPLRLHTGDTSAHTSVEIQPGSVDFLRLDVPSYAINRRGEWGSYAQYEIGLRASSSGSIVAVPLDTSKGPDSVYVVVSGDKSDPKLTTYANPPMPLAGELIGTAAVRVINAANGVGSLSVQVTNVNGAAPIPVASSLAFDTSSSDYTKIPVGSYQLNARSSGVDGRTGTLASVFLYEGLVYTVVVGSDSKSGTLNLLLSLDRSYNSQANIRARCAYLGGEPDGRNIGGTAPPAKIKWSVGGTDGAVPSPVDVQEGKVSDYLPVALPSTYDTHFSSFRVYLRISVMWVDSYSTPSKETECFTQLLPLDMETHNNTAWTFIVWGSQSGRTCSVITDFSHTLDPLALPDPSKAGVRVVAGGTLRPSFQAATVKGTDMIIVQSQTSQLGSGYTPVPTTISRITLAGSTEEIPIDDGAIVAGSLHSLFVWYGTKDTSKLSLSPPTFADDTSYGSHYSFKLRFMNALSSGPAVALTLQHGEQNLTLATPVVGSPLLAAAMHRTQLVPASCFATPGAWMQAWFGNTWDPVQLALTTQPAETIKASSCPPRCPLAEGAPIVAPASDKPQTVILGNDTTSPASPFLIAVEDDVTAPQLCNARVRLISLVSVSITATAKLGSTEIQLSSPGLSRIPQNRDPPTELNAGRWEFTFLGGSPSSSCERTLQSGRSYSLYVTSTAKDGDGLAIYTCKEEVDRNYDSVGYVRLANAAGTQNVYSMTVEYKGANCATVKNLPTTRAVGFGEHSGYTPVTVYGTTTYQVIVQQSGSVSSPTSKDIDLVAGKNWTIYALPPRDSTTSVELQAVEDGTAALWSGADDEVGLRVLDGLPEASSAQWSWKYCDEGEDDCKAVGTLAAVGDTSGPYPTAAIHGYSQWLPPRRQWRLGLEVARGSDKVVQEFGSSYTPIMSCEDGTTAVPLRARGLYTAVLTQTGDSHSRKAVLMFQDRDGEPHSWLSQYGLLAGLVVVMVVLLLALLAWCGTKWGAGNSWRMRLERNLRKCVDKLCGREAGTRDAGSREADAPLMGSDFERGTAGSE